MQPPWFEVLALYDRLLTFRDDAIVRLNRAVAVSEVHGPRAALSEIEALTQKELSSFLPFHALRADLLRRLGQNHEAATAYDAALDLRPGIAEKLWLEARKKTLSFC